MKMSNDVANKTTPIWPTILPEKLLPTPRCQKYVSLNNVSVMQHTLPMPTNRDSRLNIWRMSSSRIFHALNFMHSCLRIHHIDWYPLLTSVDSLTINYDFIVLCGIISRINSLSHTPFSHKLDNGPPDTTSCPKKDYNSPFHSMDQFIYNHTLSKLPIP